MNIEYSKILAAAKESLKRNDLYGKDRCLFHLLSNLYTHPKEKRDMADVLGISQRQLVFNYIEKAKLVAIYSCFRFVEVENVLN